MQVSNLTSNSAFYYSNSFNGDMIVPILFIFGLFILVGVSAYVLSSLERYKKLWSALKGVASLIVTALIGAVTIVVVYLGYVIFSASANTVKDVDPKIYLYAVVGFTASVIVGYFVKLAIKKVLTYHELALKEDAPKEQTTN